MALGTSKRVYKVTGTVYVEAKSVRHAAHIGKGTFQMKDDGPAIFIVEEWSVSFGQPYIVDLNKKAGSTGYIELVYRGKEDEKIGGTD